MTGFLDWLDDLPTLVLFLIFVAVGLAVALLCAWVVDRHFQEDVRSRTGPAVATVVGAVATIYAILIAFVIVNEWQSYQDAQAHVSQESAALAALYYNAGVFDARPRQDVREALLRYDRSVVNDEFPRLDEDRGASPRTTAALEHIFRAVQAHQQGGGDSAFYRQSVAELDQLTQARRSRLNAATSRLPNELFVLIALMSLALVVVAGALDTRHRLSHRVLVGRLTIVVALNLALVVSIDRPFSGGIKVSGAPLREGVLSRATHH